jgi:hypothetical protein
VRRRRAAESGHGLGFRQPLIRAVLYDEMPAPVRAAWHRDAGCALPEAAAPGRPGGPADATGGQRPRRRVVLRLQECYMTRVAMVKKPIGSCLLG